MTRRAKLLGQLDHYKRRAPHYRDADGIVRTILAQLDEPRICRINFAILNGICGALGVDRKFLISSECDFEYSGVTDAGEWALRIAEQLGADEYINPISGAQLFEPAKFVASGITLSFLQPDDIVYPRRGAFRALAIDHRRAHVQWRRRHQGSSGLLFPPPRPEGIVILRAATDASRYCHRLAFTRSARSALRLVLEHMQFPPGASMLVPAYVGVSDREGSGIGDPIRDTGSPFTLYAVDDGLRPDHDALEALLATGRHPLLLVCIVSESSRLICQGCGRPVCDTAS